MRARGSARRLSSGQDELCGSEALLGRVWSIVVRGTAKQRLCSFGGRKAARRSVPLSGGTSCVGAGAPWH